MAAYVSFFVLGGLSFESGVMIWYDTTDCLKFESLHKYYLSGFPSDGLERLFVPRHSDSERQVF